MDNPAIVAAWAAAVAAVIGPIVSVLIAHFALTQENKRRDSAFLLRRVAEDITSYRVAFLDRHCAQTKTFEAAPGPPAKSAFDPHSTRDAAVGWSEHVQSVVDKLGTFILEGYIENIRKLANAVVNRTNWVIATLDEVRETDDAVEILGRAVGYDRKRHLE